MALIQMRRGTAVEWAAENPVLEDGEVGYEIDTGRHRIGNGVDQWSNLDEFVPLSQLESIFAAAGSTTNMEQVRDAVAALFLDGVNLDSPLIFSYNDELDYIDVVFKDAPLTVENVRDTMSDVIRTVEETGIELSESDVLNQIVIYNKFGNVIYSGLSDKDVLQYDNATTAWTNIPVLDLVMQITTPVLVLGPSDPVPPGTIGGTVIVRTES